MTLKFTPPPEDAKGLPKYASYVVGAGMKTHSRLVDAKNSWRNRGWHYAETGQLIQRYDKMVPERKYVTKDAFILENVDGEWYVLYTIKAGLTEEELPWMREYMVGGWNDQPYTDYLKGHEYYQKKIASGEYKIVKKSTPMTRDEYVEWRLAIQREQLSNKFGITL